MPFFTDQELQYATVEPENIKGPTRIPEAPSSWQVAASAFRQTNSIGSAVSYINRGAFIGPRQDFYYDSVTPLMGTKYEPYVENFFDADSDEDVQVIKNKIDAEEEDRKLLGDGGGTAIAFQIAAGILDPINFIGGAGFIAKGVQAARLAKGAVATTKAIAGAAGRSAIVGAATESVVEGVLQQTQEIRPIEESLTNIGTASVISGVLGGTIAGVSKALQKKVAKDLAVDDTFKGESKFAEEEELSEFITDPTQQSIGAAVVPQTTLADETIKGVAAQSAAKAFKRLNPQFNLAQSQSLEVRKIAQQLQESSFVLQKNVDGTESPIAIETRVKLYDNFIGSSKLELQKSYETYRARIRKLSPSNEEAPLDYKNFKDQVSLAMIQGDTHVIPEVQRAAQEYRRRLFDPLLKEAQSVGALSDDIEVKTAESYLTRVYDQSKITADRQGFKKILTNWLPGRIQKDLIQGDELKNQQKALQNQLKQFAKTSKEYKEIEKALINVETKLDGYRISEAVLDEDGVSEMADEIIAHTQGQRDGLVFFPKIPMERGPLKERVLDIPDLLIRDYLNTDVEQIAYRYARAIAPQIELKRVFGSLDLKDQFRTVRQDYDKLLNATNDPKRIRELQAQRNNDIKDIEALVGRLRGTYGRPLDADHWIYTSLQTARTWNYITKLGGVTVSSIPDLARLVAIKGLAPVFTDGLIPLITKNKSFKMAASEAKLAGAAWEVALNNSRALTMAELVDPVNAGSRFRMGLEALSDKFSRATLSPYFDAARKQFSSVLIQKKNLEDIEALIADKLDQAGITNLAKNGIGKETAARIHKMWKEFGEVDGSLYIANTEKWTDKTAQLAYRAALNKQISAFSTMVGIGDKPRWMSAEIGRTLAQFESFNLAATSKVMMSNLQDSDLKTFNSIVTSVTLGMIVYAYQQWANGKEVSKKTQDWISAGFDKSGIFGILGSGNDRLARMTGNSLTAGRLIGANEQVYSIDPIRNVAQSLGPTVGMAADIGTIFKLFNEKNKWNRQDTRAIRRLIPFQNLVFIRKLFDKAEAGINKSIGVKNK